MVSLGGPLVMQNVRGEIAPHRNRSNFRQLLRRANSTQLPPLCACNLKRSLMIISHRYKFIFIKTAKTAGTSIEVFLSNCCGENDVVTPIWPHVEPHRARNYKGLWNPLPEIINNKGHGIIRTTRDLLKRNRFYNHIPALLARERMPTNIWTSYFKFCVERNPWDKTLSHYHMVNHRAGGRISFDDYIAKGNFCFNFPLYTDSYGNVLVDKVIKYESLMDELGVVFQELGIPFEGSLGVRAKSEYRKDRRPYQDIFSDKQRQIIEKAFAKEIEMHGYVF